MCQFDHRHALRPEKQQQGDDPEPYGDATVSSDGRHNVQVENRHDEQEDEVPSAEDTPKVRRVIHRKEQAKLQMAKGKWQKAKMKTALAFSRCRLDDSPLELPPFESLIAVV